MYVSFLHAVFPAFRLVCLFTLLFLGAVQEGYGQRVYADAQQSSTTTLVSGVTNQGRPIDSDTSNFSTLSITLGLGGLITANQNLQFVGRPKPMATSPIIIKFRTNGSILELLGGISAQRTNGGRTSLVTPSYSGTQLLNLLNLLGGSETAIAIIPPNGQQFDGIRLEINSTLGVGVTAYYYYAFYLTPPQVSSSILTLCGSSTGAFTIINPQPGYVYRLYSQQVGGTEVGPTTASSTLPIPSSLSGGVYWLEAREGDLYPSARIPLTVARNNVTGGGITSDQTICIGTAPALFTQTAASTGTGTLAYQWQFRTTGEYSNIPGATATTYTPPALFETTTYRRITTSTLNGVACSAFSNEITINVQPPPTITLLPISPICEGETKAALAYSTTTNSPDQYSITWDTGTPSGFTNITDAPLPASPIALPIPATVEMGTYTGTIQVKNSVAGCKSVGVPFSVQVLPQPGKPYLTITDVQN